MAKSKKLEMTEDGKWVHDLPPKKRGRKTIYTPWFASTAEKIALRGCTDLEISEILGINSDTLYQWKNRHPEFAEAIKRGKNDPNQKVIAALYQKAIGGEEVEETHVEGTVDEDGKNVGNRHVRKVRKKTAPDITAIKFIACNRMPKEWKDRQDINLSGEVATINKTMLEQLDGLPDEKLDKVLAALRGAGLAK